MKRVNVDYYVTPKTKTATHFKIAVLVFGRQNFRKFLPLRKIQFVICFALKKI